METYKRKTKDVWVIETNYGYGWEEECTYDDHMNAVRDLKEYKSMANVYHGQVRIAKRREKI